MNHAKACAACEASCVKVSSSDLSLLLCSSHAKLPCICTDCSGSIGGLSKVQQQVLFALPRLVLESHNGVAIRKFGYVQVRVALLKPGSRAECP